MKEEIWNKRGTRIINFESAHKTFNKYIVSVFRGQCIGGGQFSLCIRPYSEKECNGHKFPEGHLRRFDLKNFSHYLNNRLINFLDENKEVRVVLYEFYHYSKGKRVLHGHIVQNANDLSDIKIFPYPFTTYKSESVLREAANFLN